MKINTTIIVPILLVLLIAGCAYGDRNLGMDESGCYNIGGIEEQYDEYTDVPSEDFFGVFREIVDDGVDIGVTRAFVNEHQNLITETYEWDGSVQCGPLHYAAARGNLEVVQLLIEEQNTEVNTKTSQSEATPLHFAASAGELAVVRYLVDQGADVDATDSEGSSSLHYATRGASMDVLRFLIEEKEADADVQEDSGLTILHVAVSIRDSELAKYIIGKVSRETLNKRTKRGNTALHLATKSGQKEVVRSLLRAGADAEIENNSRRVPSQIAQDPEIKNMLLGQA